MKYKYAIIVNDINDGKIINLFKTDKEYREFMLNILKTNGFFVNSNDIDDIEYEILYRMSEHEIENKYHFVNKNEIIERG